MAGRAPMSPPRTRCHQARSLIADAALHAAADQVARERVGSGLGPGGDCCSFRASFGANGRRARGSLTPAGALVPVM